MNIYCPWRLKMLILHAYASSPTLSKHRSKSARNMYFIAEIS
jgi:hypothetical protein